MDYAGNVPAVLNWTTRVKLCCGGGTANGKFLALLALCGLVPLQTGSAESPVRLSRSTDTYFMEDDQAYSRFLWFQAGGNYRQINKDRTGSEEVDGGTWEQAPEGDITLRPINGMLTFRAVSAGPLLVLLDTQSRIDTLPALIRSITTFLSTYQDEFFARSALDEMLLRKKDERETWSDEKARVIAPYTFDTFSRSDLEEILRGLISWNQSYLSRTIKFDLADESPAPVLLIQRGAVFSKALLPKVRARYRASRSLAPPFYFARIDGAKFRQRTGVWKPFANLGGPDATASTSNPTP